METHNLDVRPAMYTYSIEGGVKSPACDPRRSTHLHRASPEPKTLLFVPSSVPLGLRAASHSNSVTFRTGSNYGWILAAFSRREYKTSLGLLSEGTCTVAPRR